MSDAPPPATTSEGIAAHIWHLQQQMSDVSSTLREMIATQHRDFKTVNDTISKLVTRSELEAELNIVRQEIQREKPSTKIKELAAWLAAITVILTFAGFSYQAMLAMSRIATTIQALPAPK